MKKRIFCAVIAFAQVLPLFSAIRIGAYGCYHSRYKDQYAYSKYEEIYGNDSIHRIIHFYDRICDDCGFRVMSGIRGNESIKAHSFSNNSCVDCGYELTYECEHLYYEDYYSYSEFEEISGDGDCHIAVHYYERVCNDCYEIIEFDIRGNETEQSHSFFGDSCYYCGYEFGQYNCMHYSCNDDYSGTEFEVIPGDESSHYAVHYYNRVCNDCGELLQSDIRGAEIDQAHTFVGDSCYYCGYTKNVSLQKLNDNYLTYDCQFNNYMLTAIREMDSYYNYGIWGPGAAATMSIASNPSLAINTIISSLGSLSFVDGIDKSLAKTAIAAYIDNMCDEEYDICVSDCVSTISAFKEWADATSKDNIINFFENIKLRELGLDIADCFIMLKEWDLDDINGGLNHYIEYLFELGFDIDDVLEKYSEILQWQNSNLDKKRAYEKIKNTFHAIDSGIGTILEAADNICCLADVFCILGDDYTAKLIKLNAFIDALESDNILYAAASELKDELENSIISKIFRISEVGINKALSTKSGLWAAVTASFALLDKNTASILQMVYLYMVDSCLSAHLMDLKWQYESTSDTMLLQEIKYELHALFDCRAYLNTLAIELNQLLGGLIIFDHTTIDELELYRNYYHAKHSYIDTLFD